MNKRRKYRVFSSVIIAKTPNEAVCQLIERAFKTTEFSPSHSYNSIDVAKKLFYEIADKLTEPRYIDEINGWFLTVVCCLRKSSTKRRANSYKTSSVLWYLTGVLLNE